MTQSLIQDAAALESLVGQAADEFLERQRRGERPQVEEDRTRHPEADALLRKVLASLEVLDFSSPSPGDALAGEPSSGTLGDFRILREVGRGGMGVVYEAEQISLARRVALKVLPFAATLDHKQIQRFKNEAQAAGQLHHTNIVAVHFVGCERGVHFYAMQFIEGQSLAQVVADLRFQILDLRKQGDGRGKLSALTSTHNPEPASADSKSEILNLKSEIPETPPNARLSTQLSAQSPHYFRTIAGLGIQAALALDHAHDFGVIHRDVKPANLLLDCRGNLWVTDFGLAQIQGDNKLTLTGDLLGTLRYMSPEQALAKRVVVDQRTDIYSLGATLYELLALEPVFPGADRQELLRQIAFEEPRPPRRHNKSIPAELETIVMKALEKNPADRYATAKELAEDLGRFVKDEPIRARRPSFMRLLRGWCRRHKLLVTGIVAIVLTTSVLTTAALWWWEHKRVATVQAVADDLQNAALWQGQERWAEALQALERARGRLEGSGQESLIARVEERRREVAFVVRLAEAQHKASSAAASGKRDYGDADRLFATAFAENGLDVASLTPEEVARKIQASAIRFATLTGLDHWAYVKEHLQDGDAKRLLAVVRLADDEKSRQGLREPERDRDRVVLKRLLEAMDIQPKDAEQYLNLGRFMLDQGRLPEAVAACRKAIESNSDPAHAALAYDALGRALRRQQQFPKAVAAHRRSIELSPKNAGLYDNLAGTLYQHWKLPQAEQAFRKAIALNPNFAGAYHNLGCVLYLQDKLPQAEAASRTAIDLRATHLPNAYHTLGHILRAQGRLSEADAAQQKAIELDTGQGEANSGHLLMGEGKFSDALAAFRRAQSAKWSLWAEGVRWAEHWVQLDAKLSKIMKGEALPADSKESLALAELCQLRSRQLYATSVRFYVEAFAADPTLVGELRAGIRYGAACAATQAACGQGKDAGNLEANEYARLHAQARAWLRADLAAWRAELEKEPQTVRNGVLYEIRQRREDSALSGVRDANALATLPEAERREWHKLWQDVDSLEQVVPKDIVVYEQTLKARKAKLGPDHQETLRSMGDLANMYLQEGRLQEAVTLFEETLAQRKAKLGPDDPATLRDMHNLANFYGDAGRRQEAVALFEQVLEIKKAKLGADHPDTHWPMHDLAYAYYKAGRRQEGLALFEQTVAKKKAALGHERHDYPNMIVSTTMVSMMELAYFYEDSGKLDKAERLLLDVVAHARDKEGPQLTARALGTLGVYLLKQKRYVEAERFLRECLAIREKQLPDHWLRFTAVSMLGDALLGQRKYAAAEPLLLEGYDGIKQREAKIPKGFKTIRQTEAVERIVRLYEATGQNEKARMWREKLPASKSPAGASIVPRTGNYHHVDKLPGS